MALVFHPIMSASIPEAAYHLLDDVHFAHVATIRHDGTPQTTPVWIAREGDVALFNTAKNRAKFRNLQRDPRVALSIHNTEKKEQPYEWIRIRGRAEFEDDADLRHINQLSHKYTGKDYRYRVQPGAERVIVRVIPEHVLYSG
jgi:PPOX class probable F420-dependent enzyme